MGVHPWINGTQVRPRRTPHASPGIVVVADGSGSFFVSKKTITQPSVTVGKEDSDAKNSVQPAGQ